VGPPTPPRWVGVRSGAKAGRISALRSGGTAEFVVICGICALIAATRALVGKVSRIEFKAWVAKQAHVFDGSQLSAYDGGAGHPESGAGGEDPLNRRDLPLGFPSE